jgi:hypothetical protein
VAPAVKHLSLKGKRVYNLSCALAELVAEPNHRQVACADDMTIQKQKRNRRKHKRQNSHARKNITKTSNFSALLRFLIKDTVPKNCTNGVNA